ncbi:cytochrome P450 9e2 isoform X1 [Nasonia vitripennis]|uniref:Cytochrome P450 n=2 Tax=Nasonia vitripennis TaxID=7425 RepID=A0A7M7G8P7_NASVI|nr:cytochrome P450 9e2 isoform X1 [Nasonia vitripennis]
MEFCTWCLILGACGLIYYFFKKRLSYFEDLGVPYVPGWPFFGNMSGPFLFRKHVTEALVDLYKTNPETKYIGIFVFNARPVILLRDLEIIKTIAIKNSDKFPDHLAFATEDMDPMFGANLFNMTGDRWREMRSILRPAFTSSKLKAMFHLMVECAENFVKYVDGLPANLRKFIATKDLFAKYTNDVIAICAFGISVDTLKDPNNDFYVLGRQATNLEGVLAFKMFLFRSFPAIVKLFNLRFVTPKVVNFFTNIVKTTVKTRDEKGITRPDMLQLMMDARSKGSKGLEMDLNMMTAQVFSFFFGGFDTTSSQMCLMAHELAINPDVQKKLQDEVDQVLRDTNGKPTYDAINAMQYLDAIFNETLRKHTQGFMLDRLCRADLEIPPALPGGKPLTLKPGMNVWIPSYALHHDPHYYEDPEKFDPERYVHKKVSINDAINLGFGTGPRSCIGYRFATMEVKILFFHLLAKFSFKPNENTCSPLTYDRKKFILVPEKGFSLAIESRN